MASIVSHIIYARKYLGKHPMPNGDEDSFVLGCVFPDIRRIDPEIKRKDTHLCFDPIDLDFAGLSSFRAGWKFHLFCDMKREEVLNKYNFYSLPNTADFWHQSSKMLEDEIAYARYANWEKLTHYFNNPPIPSVFCKKHPSLILPFPRGGSEGEVKNNVSRETFSLWYAILARYIEKQPDSRAMHIFLSKQPSFAEKADEIVDTVDKLRKNEKAIEILKKVAEEIV